jgi:hypothetical protein
MPVSCTKHCMYSTGWGECDTYPHWRDDRQAQESSIDWVGSTNRASLGEQHRGAIQIYSNQHRMLGPKLLPPHILQVQSETRSYSFRQSAPFYSLGTPIISPSCNFAISSCLFLCSSTLLGFFCHVLIAASAEIADTYVHILICWLNDFPMASAAAACCSGSRLEIVLSDSCNSYNWRGLRIDPRSIESRWLKIDVPIARPTLPPRTRAWFSAPCAAAIRISFNHSTCGRCYRESARTASDR